MKVTSGVRLHEAVALTEDLPEHGLVRGQVGTVVEIFADDAFEVEFSDNDGRTYASLALRAAQLIVLQHRPVAGRPNATGHWLAVPTTPDSGESS